MQATKQTLGAAKTYSTGFSSDNFPADGLLGMAFKSLSDYKANPLFQSLAAQGKTSSSVFSFKLASSGSELYLGGKNSNLYTGSITYTPVTDAVSRIRSLTRSGTLTWFMHSPTGRSTWTDWRLTAHLSFRRLPPSSTRAPPRLLVTLTALLLSTTRSAVRYLPRNTAMASTQVRSQHSLHSGATAHYHVSQSLAASTLPSRSLLTGRISPSTRAPSTSGPCRAARLHASADWPLTPRSLTVSTLAFSGENGTECHL